MKYKLIIAFIIIVLLVGYGLLGIDYVKQRQGHDALAVSMAEMARELQQIPAPAQNLEQRLAAAAASLAATQSAFPAKPNSTQIINRILKLADECQVKAIPLVTQQWSSEKAGKGYLAFGLQLTVQGRFDQFVDFMNQLENGEFDTLVIEDLSVTKVTNKAEGKALPDTTSPIKANLDVAIYARSVTDD
ncbi:hypothetical protein ACFLXF_04995 [Chloroflexota bacterium]